MAKTRKFNEITFTDTTVIKQSVDVFPSLNAASEYAERILSYDDRLARTGILTPKILSAKGFEDSNGLFRVEHVHKKIEGSLVSELDLARRRMYIARAIATIWRAPRNLNRVDSLSVPVDAKPNNYIVTPSGKLFLIDVSPALSWQGAHVITRLPLFEDKMAFTVNCGRVLSVMARMALGARDLPPEGPARDDARREYLKQPAWHACVMPKSLTTQMFYEVRDHMQAFTEWELEWSGNDTTPSSADERTLPPQ
jgi:hypothetical protein